MWLVFVFTLAIFLLVVWVLLTVKTPRYQMQKTDVIRLLQAVLVGQASENDWAIFLASPFRHHPGLAMIQGRCLEIDEKEYIGHSPSGYLFTQHGLWLLKLVLEEVQNLPTDGD